MYGRPPARWLIADSLKPFRVVTFKDIAKSTKTPLTAVRKLSENYADFIKLKYIIDPNTQMSNALLNTRRLFHLHSILAADRAVRIQLGKYEAAAPHSVLEAFGKLLQAARKSGLKTKMRVPKSPSKVSEYRESLLKSLKILY